MKCPAFRAVLDFFNGGIITNTWHSTKVDTMFLYCDFIYIRKG